MIFNFIRNSEQLWWQKLFMGFLGITPSTKLRAASSQPTYFLKLCPVQARVDSGCQKYFLGKGFERSYQSTTTSILESSCPDPPAIMMEKQCQKVFCFSARIPNTFTKQARRTQRNTTSFQRVQALMGGHEKQEMVLRKMLSPVIQNKGYIKLNCPCQQPRSHFPSLSSSFSSSLLYLRSKILCNRSQQFSWGQSRVSGEE